MIPTRPSCAAGPRSLVPCLLPVAAQRLAEEAEADAVLAEARARETRSEAALNEIRASLRALRDALPRS